MTSAGNGTFADLFGYNGLDQRTGKVDGGITFNYTRPDDAIDSSVLSDGAGSGLVSEGRGGTSKFYHADGHGSTGALTSSTGATTDTLTADAFGMTVTGSGTTPTPFGYAGQGGYQSDGDTGLMLLGHRYYDNSTGRFLSRDPIRAGHNWYTYCGNDPVNGEDRTGLILGPDDAIEQQLLEEAEESPLGQEVSEWTSAELGDMAKEATKSFSRVRTIAKAFDITEVERLVGDYSWAAQNWVKQSTRVVSDDMADAGIREIHWYENLRDSIGRVEFKPKF